MSPVRDRQGLGLHRARAGLVALAVLVGCGSSSEGEPGPRWLDDTSEPLPEVLSGVGLFADVTARRAHGDVIAFEPRHALYSNGLAKERLAYLPDGATIDPTNPRAWAFPDGTVLAKTFLAGDVPVETRLVILGDDGWDYALYEWDADGTDAIRRSGNWPEETVTVEGIEHTLPARLDCRTCHETSEDVTGSPVLGISPYQIADDLAGSRAFDGEPPRVEVEGRSDVETAVLGYFVGNCISCHSGGDDINASFSLYPEVAVDNTVGRELDSEMGEGIRVVPGDISASELYTIVVLAAEPGYDGSFDVMPPLGVDRKDPEVAGMLRAWIESL